MKHNIIFNLSPKVKKQVSVKKLITLIFKNTKITKIKVKKINNIIKEKKYLHISSSKAQKFIPWSTRLDLKIALKLTIQFYLLNKDKMYEYYHHYFMDFVNETVYPTASEYLEVGG